MVNINSLSEKNINDLSLSDSVLLQRNVELETKKELEELANKVEVIEKPLLTNEDKIKIMLENVKKKKKSKNNKMIID